MPYGFELFQLRSCKIDRRVLVDQANHILVFKRHDPRSYTLRLLDYVSELAHWNTVLVLPLHHGLEVPALPIDAEVWIWLVSYVDPVVWNTKLSITLLGERAKTYE